MKTLLIVVMVATLGACAETQHEPTTLSSAEATGYAQRYPDELTFGVETLQNDEAETARVTDELPPRVRDVPANSQSELVVSILDAADEAGRSREYADAMSEARVVRRFIDEERGALAARAAASAAPKLTEAQCSKEVDLSGSVAYALKEGGDKQLEKRLRARSDAQLIIERNKVALGQPSVIALQKLADDIALASYMVHVALPTDARRLASMLDEKGEVKSTLDKSVTAEIELQQQGGRSEAERRASRTRVEELRRSQSSLDAAVQRAEQSTVDLDKRIDAAKKSYTDALARLKDAVQDAAQTGQGTIASR